MTFLIFHDLLQKTSKKMQSLPKNSWSSSNGNFNVSNFVVVDFSGSLWLWFTTRIFRRGIQCLGSTPPNNRISWNQFFSEKSFHCKDILQFLSFPINQWWLQLEIQKPIKSTSLKQTCAVELFFYYKAITHPLAARSLQESDIREPELGDEADGEPEELGEEEIEEEVGGEGDDMDVKEGFGQEEERKEIEKKEEELGEEKGVVAAPPDADPIPPTQPSPPPILPDS